MRSWGVVFCLDLDICFFFLLLFPCWVTFPLFIYNLVLDHLVHPIFLVRSLYWVKHLVEGITKNGIECESSPNATPSYVNALVIRPYPTRKDLLCSFECNCRAFY
jgi:hypothetical protein